MGAFRSFYWGFLLTMLDFRFNGFDILPDLLGFIFFAIGINALLAESEHFQQASKFNVAMIIFSLFSLYQAPVQQGFHLDFQGLLLGIASLIALWYLIYHLFMGISELASRTGQIQLQEEAVTRWEQYRQLLIATIAAFFLIIIPPLAVIMMFGLLIANIILAIGILGFLKTCEERL